ncbi:hypothetical protein [Parasitella parasitica]|uniref:F-box domain-containing protein n=1 Tax=Parasitella parasitica TaxID=35722 RepID=A0A0B7NA15_9FUNG|nr:hypothetical protein [Parasitella parasitica]
MSFSKLPPNIIECIAFYLKPKDLREFGLCSRTQYNHVLANDEFWKSKSKRDFGDLFRLYNLFVKSTGLELSNDLSKKFEREPKSWRVYYISKTQSIKNADNDTLRDQGNKEYKDARRSITTLQDDMNYSVLVHVASKMLWILDILPGHAGCYYILSFILFIMDRLEDALDVLDMGRLVDSSFEPFKELEKKILCIMESDEGGSNDLPLLINDNLSPELLKVLFEIFSRFDEDNDDCLNPKELDLFVFSTNGQHPPTSFIKSMAQRFGANDQGWLTKKGFLAFYLEQTLDDPSETKKDIRAHGYDCSKLQKLIVTSRAC